MLKLLQLLLGGNTNKSVFRELTESVRELIKGKEVDPAEVIKMVHELNKAEAQHRSIFVAGWRPACGWCCALTLFAHYILFPFISTYTQYETPILDTTFMNTLLMGMLGIGGLRTYEKMKGKA